MISMRTHSSLLLALFLGISMIADRAHAQTNPNSNPAPSPPAVESDSPSWLFPVAKLDERLPRWLHIGGQYRDRLEGPIGIGYTGTNDFYLLDRFRLIIGIRPKEWLTFFGEVQDSRIFFNHHIANANPFEDSWTLWQSYAQVGSSTSGWVDALAGRQVLLFGDERVIGPSNWLNVGRTFDVARIDLHHPRYQVSVFASSVVPGSSTYLHRAIPGNNFYGVYGSFNNIVPNGTFEPYVLWRVAPPNPQLPEEVGPTPNLTARPALSAYIPSAHGRAMSAGGRRFPALPQRRGFISKAITRLERKIRPVVTGIPLTRSILPITTS